MRDAGAGQEDPFLLIGRIRKPHGVRGELFIWTETDRPAEVFRPGRRLWIGDEHGSAGEAALTVERARPFKDGFLVKTMEHSRRDEALDSLRGHWLYIRRSEAAPLESDEVYYHDLVGMRVLVDGETVGTVREVYETPGPDLLVVEREARPELLVPFVREMVHRIDVDGRAIEITPPAGLLEL